MIEGAHIVSVGEGKLKPTIDLSRQTVMPGGIDTHVHLNWHFDENHKNVSEGEPNGDAQRYTAGECEGYA